MTWHVLCAQSALPTKCYALHIHVQVDDLYDHPFFKEYMQIGDSEAVFVPPEMLATFLSLENGQLSKRWQVWDTDKREGRETVGRTARD